MQTLPGLRVGLLKHSLENEVVVYDPDSDQIHLLDVATAATFDLCATGNHNEASAAAELSRTLGVYNGSEVLELALEQLSGSGLIENAAGSIDLSRRDMLRKAAIAGAAAFAMPAIATLTATRGYAQGSGNVALCGACTSDLQCANGATCQTNTGGTACGNPGAPNGSSCTNNGLCCSNRCQGGICVPNP